MLDVSRIVTGKLSMSMAPVSLRALVEDTVEQMQDRFMAANVKITVLPGQDVQVRADAGRLAQVIDNLLSNALRYGNGGAVEIQVLERDGFAHAIVRDEGPGILPGDLPRIVRPTWALSWR